MNQENLLSKLMNILKFDKYMWCIVAAFSMFILLFSRYSLPVSLIYICVGVACSIIIAHIPHKYFKLVTFPLITMTIMLMVAGLFVTPSDVHWLLLGTIPFSPLSFSLLTVCMLLTAIAMKTDNKQKMIGVSVLLAICIISFTHDISYASLLTTTVVLGMLMLGIYRKTVIRIIYVLIVVGILLVGSAFLLGRNVEERRDDSVTQKAELYSAFQKRMDEHKELLIKVFALDTADTTPSQNETQVDKHGVTSILAASYHNIYNHTGVWGGIAVSGLYIFLLCRVVCRLESSKSKFAKCLALCCSIALVVDSIYNACVAGTSNPNIVTSAMIQYVMFGIILSCLGSCEKTSNGRIKALFKTITEV